MKNRMLTRDYKTSHGIKREVFFVEQKVYRRQTVVPTSFNYSGNGLAAMRFDTFHSTAKYNSGGKPLKAGIISTFEKRDFADIRNENLAFFDTLDAQIRSLFSKNDTWRIENLSVNFTWKVCSLSVAKGSLRREERIVFEAEFDAFIAANDALFGPIRPFMISYGKTFDSDIQEVFI